MEEYNKINTDVIYYRRYMSMIELKQLFIHHSTNENIHIETIILQFKIISRMWHLTLKQENHVFTR